MKRWLKRIALGVLALVVLAVAGVLVFFFGLHPKLRDPPDLNAASTPAAIARGQYLAVHVTGCASCHSPIDESKPGSPADPTRLFAGRRFGAGLPGRVIAPNLTPDREHGIGAWSDGEIARAIREGVDREGRALFPMMPYGHLRTLTDDDTLAIIAYLRSVPPLPDDLPATSLDFPVSMFVRLAPKPLSESPPPWPTDPVERGKVLLEVMSCIDCHTPIKRGQLVESLRFAGGMTFTTPLGTVQSPNITSDTATGIGSYTDDELVRVFRDGQRKDGRLIYVMPWTAYRGLTDDDLRALIAALRRIPAISNTIPPAKLGPG